MMDTIIHSDILRDFDHYVFNTSWGTEWEIVGQKKLSLKRAFRRLNLSLQLSQKVAEIKPDIIHFHCGSGGKWDFPGDMLLHSFARLTSKAKILFHWHRDPSSTYFPNKNFLTRLFFQATVGSSDAIGVLLESYREVLEKERYSNKVFIIPNTIDPKILSLPSHRPSEETLNVIFIGRLTREKGIYDLFEIAANIVKEFPNVKFYIAGTPRPDEGGISAILSVISEYGLSPYIELVDSITEETKYKFFQNGDVLLFPSYRESFGLVALEALAAGVPVVGYSIGAMEEFSCDGKAILLADPGDIECLTKNLAELLQSPFIREKMGNFGRNYVKNHYSPEKVINKIKEIYQIL